MYNTLDDIHHIAIVRGVDSETATEVAEAFYENGFRAIEVPLNSPNALESIRRMVDRFGDKMLVGAGTVVSIEQVQQVADCGGRLIVSPNTNGLVIVEAKKLGLISMPGAMTPTECFAGLNYGADALKLFPASVLGTETLVAYKAVLPLNTKVFAMGGIAPDNALLGDCPQGVTDQF